MRSLPISGSDYWTKVERFMANAEVRHFNDGSVQYAVLHGSAKMVIIHRTLEELFETTVRRAVVLQDLKAAINGNWYDVSNSGLLDALIGHDPILAFETTPIGHVVVGGRVVAGTSEPDRFYVGRLSLILQTAFLYEFDLGDPPSAHLLSTAIGGLGPMIINGLKFGSRNLYRAGVPSGAPATGDPGSQFRPFLIQRSNNTYRAFAALPAATGKVLLAVSQSHDKILLIVQRHGAANPPTLDAFRDKLANVGIENAVFLDGSDSVMLNIDGTFHVRMGLNKDECCTVGIGFKYDVSPIQSSDDNTHSEEEDEPPEQEEVDDGGDDGGIEEPIFPVEEELFEEELR